MTSFARPFTFINAAMSADGKISTRERRQTKISGDGDLERRDELRASSDAVIAGIGTILSDNPSMTVKSRKRREKRAREGEDEDPIRVVIDNLARTPVDADILKKGAGRRIIFVSERAPQKKLTALKKFADVIVAGKAEVDLKKALSALHRTGIKRAMIEGGATLNWSMLSHGLVDEVYTFVGSLIIGGKNAPTLVDGSGFSGENAVKLELIGAEKIDDGILVRWKVLNRIK
jgi:2,5-diamino-6-(ribosylamino)-4(3H)-pyrimidinone 5'-phosphate reductase